MRYKSIKTLKFSFCKFLGSNGLSDLYIVGCDNNFARLRIIKLSISIQFLNHVFKCSLIFRAYRIKIQNIKQSKYVQKLLNVGTLWKETKIEMLDCEKWSWKFKSIQYPNQMRIWKQIFAHFIFISLRVKENNFQARLLL